MWVKKKGRGRERERETEMWFNKRLTYWEEFIIFCVPVLDTNILFYNQFTKKEITCFAICQILSVVGDPLPLSDTGRKDWDK